MVDDPIDGLHRVPLEFGPHLGGLGDGIDEVVIAAGASPRARTMPRGRPRQRAPIAALPHRIDLLTQESGEFADGEGRIQEIGAHVEHGAPMYRRRAQDRRARRKHVFVESAGPMTVEVETVGPSDLDDSRFCGATRTGGRTGALDDGRGEARARETRPEQMLEEGRPDRVGGAHDEDARRRCGDDGSPLLG